MKIFTLALVLLAGNALTCFPAQAQDRDPKPPQSLVELVAVQQPLSKAQIATRNVYGLNDEMRGIYQNSLGIFRKNFLKKNNLIMGLFTGKGGRFILYQAGKDPIEAPTAPMYETAKSIGHAPMALYEIAAPYVLDPKGNPAWQGPMKSFRYRAVIARDSLADLDVKPEHRALFLATLDKLISFADTALQDGTFTYAQLKDFTHDIETQERALTSLCAQVQVEHWFKVLDEWKTLLGNDWDKTYGLTNSIYVTRQNNILFSVMAQYFGEAAINDRLLMIETTSFQTTPEEMLDVFSHVVADRTLSEVFFNTDRIMDSELLGWEGRNAIESQMKKRGRTAVLPPLVPLNSNEWPWRTDPTKGSGPKSFDDLRSSGFIKK